MQVVAKPQQDGRARFAFEPSNTGFGVIVAWWHRGQARFRSSILGCNRSR
jgi:hypothetical protein